MKALASLDLTSEWDNNTKVVVITGGGTGIGRMLAEGFVENGAQVIIIGRRGDVLDKTVREINEEYGGKAGHVIRCARTGCHVDPD